MPRPLEGSLARLNRRIDRFAHQNGARALRISIGVVFLWFGLLKFFPNFSPAEAIAVQTLRALTFDMIPADGLLLGLAVFETVLGACFVVGMWRPIVVPLLVLHMLGTATPFMMFPAELFTLPFVPTFIGQYIIKNVIIVSGALVLRRSWA